MKIRYKLLRILRKYVEIFIESKYSLSNQEMVKQNHEKTIDNGEL